MRNKKGKIFSFLFPAFLFITIWNILLIGGSSISNMNTFNRIQTKQSLKNNVVLFSKIIENITDPATLIRLSQEVSLDGQVSYSVLTPKGRVIASNEATQIGLNHSKQPEISAVLNGGHYFTQRVDSISQREYYLASYYNPQQFFIVRVQLPTSKVHANTKDFLASTFFTGLISLFVSLLLAYFASKKISSPIIKLQKVAQRYARRELQGFREDQPWEEFESLSHSLTQMAREIDLQINNLTLQKQETQAILTSMTEGVIALDLEFRLKSANESAEKLLHFKSTPVINQAFFDVVLSTNLQELAKETVQTRQEVLADFTLNQGDEDKILEFRGNLLIDEDGQTIGIIAVLNDVTQTRLFDQMRRDFVANVSHELRTPITSIQGFLEILMEDEEVDPKEQARFMKIIERQTKRLGTIIEDLLSLSRLDQMQDSEALPKNWRRLNALFSSAKDLCVQLAESKNIQLHFHREEHAEIKMNQGLMEQALVNLINNAIKYSPENTEVHIRIRDENNWVFLEVQDQGPGIPSEYQERLFERFFRMDKARSRAAGGTGLGLAIVKHIARLHDAEAGLNSQLGQGSTFYIKIPRSGIRNIH